ncbi:MAG: hypothetical protein A3C02_04475 [Candidatus Andersenbacteria bacterium RIFCSPHIGHO2_02_FULL_45_11]|uniref:Replication-associated protein G2P N-terminal domain-containing protein n=1 Tax=Candidatus Andersenbacteria bacterium RIFCSPHIGHO2_12_FULL_45_11 TaxID=1797281 RepID=A0A1G1X2X0_9BACT|nr:MAG: hypothetical protein A2805_02835 [Candidatus Andersenbacteria bacterium RIFCSPHIGHO2_01_FULL_46_36]OGY32165.1 MAG: hypothetical protein A3C02_04475 [Candidatus Andersenbacteria bacterium RIFCSPHIGHO2_02_FULL_45_11]OGY34313.1 MAG: hypothetical protein A3D99_04575 [Candidatus Andersenbacteria bacterium RIFCSPHIGHO2_12_FULL_45_11]
MIDSVLLKIPDFILFSSQHFTHLKYQEFRGKYGLFGKFETRYTDYPQEMKKKGLYFPQVNLMQRQRLLKGTGGRFSKERYLLVQVSIPKLLYGTSIFDADERVLPLFAIRLKEALLAINVRVTETAIMEAVVQRIDYSKVLRISSTYGSTASLIREMAAYDNKQSSDFNQNKFYNGKDGLYLKFYNSSQGLVIYDKFEEITTNGTTKLEQEIAKGYKRGDMVHGALRIELSLQLKHTVDSALRRFYKTKKKNFTLPEAARPDIGKQLLIESFEKVYVRGFSGTVYLSKLKDAELYNQLRASKVPFQQQAILYLLTNRVRAVGLKTAIAELKGQVSASSIGRYKKQTERVLEIANAKHDKVNAVAYLRRKLKQFTPIIPKQLDTILGATKGVRKL